VRGLQLKSGDDWRTYCNSGKKPSDIPSNPENKYAKAGWVSWGDWLGTDTIAHRLRQYRSFKKARAFVRRLGLKSFAEWQTYLETGKKPTDIPAAPHHKYAEAGWAGYGDWLGTGAVAPRLRQYRSFNKARSFVRRLGLKSVTEWSAYCKSDKKPDDIPATPERTYAQAGWAGHSDWLGTGTVAPRLRQYRSFKEARAFVHGLQLKSGDDWKTYCKSGKKPYDIPAHPAGTYAEAGWIGMGDWLASGAVATFLRQYRSFKKARAFVRGLQLKSGDDWRTYCNSGKKPSDIPSKPSLVYAKAGWVSMGDWLGTGAVATRLRRYRSFKKARAFARTLGLRTAVEWFDYSRTGRKPADIPVGPNQVYAKTGWAGWGDWLGTGAVAPRLRQYRSFNKARAFARRLYLKSTAEWSAYCKSGKKPTDIPSNPRLAYANAGWVSMGDWIGTGAVASTLRQYRSFKKARGFVRRLGLKSGVEWLNYSRSGRKPDDIPATPERTYAETGWTGMGDWLGTGAVASTLRHYRSFKKARAFVRGLGLKSVTEWLDYSKLGKKPADIPSAADRIYAEDGWAGWGDWLGTSTVATRLREYRSFKKARTFVRSLGLKSGAEWKNYSKSGKKPIDIPAVPTRTYAGAGWAGMSDWLGNGLA
jgi:hypothetical protein